MDVKIKSDVCDFKMRVSGVLEKDGKLLTVNICDNGFYCLPGGHVWVGETSKQAIQREMKEEVGVSLKSEKLIALVETFFNAGQKVIHEVCYVYSVEAVEDIETKDHVIIENDDGEEKKLDFRWFDIKNLKDANFRPDILAGKLESGDMTFQHIIYDQTN